MPDWRPVTESAPTDGATVYLYRAGDLYPVVGGRIVIATDAPYDLWLLEEGGPEDGEHRGYPQVAEGTAWEPTHWAPIDQDHLPLPMEEAPASLWEPLRSLLSDLEVGEIGVLRVPVDVPEGQSLGDLWWLPFATPPLRPGRYWVPEEWRRTADRTGAPSHPPYEYRADYRGVRNTGVWITPWIMPAAAARLACSVGKPMVKAWCEGCGGEEECRASGDPEPHCCPACGGTPPPTWVYEVTREEVP